MLRAKMLRKPVYHSGRIVGRSCDFYWSGKLMQGLKLEPFSFRVVAQSGNSWASRLLDSRQTLLGLVALACQYDRERCSVVASP